MTHHVEFAPTPPDFFSDGISDPALDLMIVLVPLSRSFVDVFSSSILACLFGGVDCPRASEMQGIGPRRMKNTINFLSEWKINRSDMALVWWCGGVVEVKLLKTSVVN